MNKDTIKLPSAEPLSISADEARRLAGAAWRISNHYAAERADVERRLLFAYIHADATFDPSFGMPLTEYRHLCLHNAICHICRQLRPLAAKAESTDHLADPIRGNWTLGDVLSERRNGPSRMHRTIAIREWLDGLFGLPWCVAIASLCGLTFSEIARKLGIARSTFDRRFAGIFASLQKEVGHA